MRLKNESRSHLLANRFGAKEVELFPCLCDPGLQAMQPRLSRDTRKLSSTLAFASRFALAQSATAPEPVPQITRTRPMRLSEESFVYRIAVPSDAAPGWSSSCLAGAQFGRRWS